MNEPRPSPPRGKPDAWVNGWCTATGYAGGGMPPSGAASKREDALYRAGFKAGHAAIVYWLARGNTTKGSA